MSNPKTPWQEAQDAYNESSQRLQDAAIAEAWRIVLEHFPDAVSFTTSGTWEPDGEDGTVVRLNLDTVDTGSTTTYRGVGTRLVEIALLETALDQSEVFLWLGDVGETKYLGEIKFDRPDDHLVTFGYDPKTFPPRHVKKAGN